VYGGDTNFTTSGSSALTQTVSQDSSTTSIASSVNPSVFGQSVTFTATVKAATPGSGTPTGIVTFMDGSTTLGTGTLSSGKATFKTNALAVGSDAITAVYSGDANFTTSTSAAVTQKVNQASTTTTLASSVNPSTAGQSVTFTATITATSPGSGTPTGTVTFKDGSTILGTATLSGGTASLSISTLSVGTHSITAVYGGDSNFKSSTSAILRQSVQNAARSSWVVEPGQPGPIDQALGVISAESSTTWLIPEVAAEQVAARSRQKVRVRV
jgi:hypothetical protein